MEGITIFVSKFFVLVPQNKEKTPRCHLEEGNITKILDIRVFDFRKIWSYRQNSFALVFSEKKYVRLGRAKTLVQENFHQKGEISQF